MALIDRARQGLPIEECLIIDQHMHNARVPKFFSRFDYYRDLIAQMDAIGIDCGIASNLYEVEGSWKRHEEIIEMNRLHPGRLYGQLSPDPNLPTFRKELETFAPHPAFVGIKVHPVENGKDLMCEEYRFAYEFAAEQNLPVLIHTWGMGDMLRFYDIAKQYPNTALILGHSGGDEVPLAEAIRLAATFPNIYLDTACSYVWFGAIEAMVAGAGANKVLFGSDAYWNSMEAAIGRIIYADISEEDKKLILGGNANRLYRLREQA